MRSIIEKFLPNFNISLCIALGVVTVLDIYNPMMGFLRGTPAVTLIMLTCAVSIINAAVSYVSWRERRKKAARAAQRRRRAQYEAQYERYEYET